MLLKSLGNSPIQYHFEHFDLEKRFHENVEISLYRIIQELISNIIRHSAATEVSIQLFKNQQKVVLIVEDNGIGFDALQKAEGIGLMNIKSRLNTLNGEVNYTPSPGSGTVATIRIPIG
jgi:signal transduction histidine kinase